MGRIIDPKRLEAVNAVLAMFSTSQLTWRRGFYVSWPTSDGGEVAWRWHCRGGQDFYPTWHNRWPGGGTASTAMSQLIRWLRDEPVLPISTWEYWTGPKVALGRDNGPEIVRLLREAGYPEHACCVLCGNRIEGGLDWWNLKGVSGPCCGWTTGCRQRTK